MNKRIISGIAAMTLVFSTAAIPAFADEADGDYDVNPNFSVGDTDEDNTDYSFVDSNAFDDDSASNTVATEEPAVEANVDDADFYGVPGYGYGYGYGVPGYNFGKKPAKKDDTTTKPADTSATGTSPEGSGTTTEPKKEETKKPEKKKLPYTWEVSTSDWFMGKYRDNSLYGLDFVDYEIPYSYWAYSFGYNGVDDGKPTQAPVFTNWFNWKAPKTVKCTKKTKKADDTKKCTKKKTKKTKKCTKKANTCKNVTYIAPTPAPKQVVSYAPVYNFRSFFRSVYLKNNKPTQSYWGWAKFPFKTGYTTTTKK